MAPVQVGGVPILVAKIFNDGGNKEILMLIKGSISNGGCNFKGKWNIYGW